MARKLDAANKKWSWKMGCKRQAGARLGPIWGAFGARLGPNLFWDPFGPVWGPFVPRAAKKQQKFPNSGAEWGSDGFLRASRSGLAGGCPSLFYAQAADLVTPTLAPLQPNGHPGLKHQYLQ